MENWYRDTLVVLAPALAAILSALLTNQYNMRRLAEERDHAREAAQEQHEREQKAREIEVENEAKRRYLVAVNEVRTALVSAYYHHVRPREFESQTTALRRELLSLRLVPSLSAEVQGKVIALLEELDSVHYIFDPKFAAHLIPDDDRDVIMRCLRAMSALTERVTSSNQQPD